MEGQTPAVIDHVGTSWFWAYTTHQNGCHMEGRTPAVIDHVGTSWVWAYTTHQNGCYMKDSDRTPKTHLYQMKLLKYILWIVSIEIIKH